MLKRTNLLRAVLAILIIFIPLYPKFPLASVTGTYVAIRLDDFVVAVAVLIWFIDQLRRKFPILKEPVTKLFLAYYLAIFASLLASVFIFQTDPKNILLLNFLRRFEYTSLFFVAYSAIKSESKLWPFYLTLALTTVGVFVYGYGQKFLNFPVISTMNEEFSKGQLLQMDNWTRISSTFAGHYDLAAFLSVLLVIVGGVIVTTKKLWLKIANIIIWLGSYYILVLTASRVSFFAFFGGLCLTLVLLRRFIWILPVTALFLYSLFNSGDLTQRLIATIPAFKHEIPTSPVATPKPTAIPTAPVIALVTPVPVKITPVPTVIRHGPVEEQIPIDTDVGVARSGEIRFNAEWPRAITAFRKNPLVGTGLGSITLATDNDYLRTLGESGILGFVTFAVLMFYFIFRSFKFIPWGKRHPGTLVPVIMLGALITFLVNATLIDVFEASKTAYLFWMMMGIYYFSLQSKKSS